MTDHQPAPFILAAPTGTGWTGRHHPATDGRPSVAGPALAALAARSPHTAAALAHPGNPAGPDTRTLARWLYIFHADRIEIRRADIPGRWTTVATIPHHGPAPDWRALDT